MVKHRTHSAEFKRQVVQENLDGETLHGRSPRFSLSLRPILADTEAQA